MTGLRWPAPRVVRIIHHAADAVASLIVAVSIEIGVTVPVELRRRIDPLIATARLRPRIVIIRTVAMLVVVVKDRANDASDNDRSRRIT
ncbi:hypothetical protein CN311_31215 [Mesorhizobium sanjuanii]|uniref:Uncharacterized protein n=1 Tax=Mesorhizobium sanjuanii TaxID=2037900 RepID=A0A2A6F691_9HYPH|nr:hypothetical protein CN311_31215 [Mesorhizobium sanjuanii]